MCFQRIGFITGAGGGGGAQRGAASKGGGGLAVLVINRVPILAIFELNREWFLYSSHSR